MRLEEFDFTLPPSLIAQYPSPKRGESRLMVLQRDRGTIEHQQFSDIVHYLHPGDLLVLNNTRVLPARLIGRREGGGKCELLILSSWSEGQQRCKVLVKHPGRIKGKAVIRFDHGIEGKLEVGKDGKGEIVFSNEVDIAEIISKIGHMPLPPYIKRSDEPLDRDRYQTVFAERDGSIAAPTAGLHFTPLLLESIRERGVKIATITLHIGTGTFATVRVKEVEDHRMEEEWVEISQETSQEIEGTKKGGGRVIAVGTTTTRALESFIEGNGKVRAGRGLTSLFIYPPYRFRLIDGLITNFHLPKSTLIMLVSAFAGIELIRMAYQEAIEKGYRFYSYGDAMLIL